MLVKLTKEQAAMIEWALFAGLQQQKKFMMHDDWQEGLAEESILETKRIERQFEKAHEAFYRAFVKALGQK